MEYDWIEMMERMQDIRLFCSLHVRRAKKGGISSAQELDLLSRVARRCVLETAHIPYALRRDGNQQAGSQPSGG